MVTLCFIVSHFWQKQKTKFEKCQICSNRSQSESGLISTPSECRTRRRSRVACLTSFWRLTGVLWTLFTMLRSPKLRQRPLGMGNLRPMAPTNWIRAFILSGQSRLITRPSKIYTLSSRLIQSYKRQPYKQGRQNVNRSSHQMWEFLLLASRILVICIRIFKKAYLS